MEEIIEHPSLRDNLESQVIKGRNIDILDQATNS